MKLKEESEKVGLQLNIQKTMIIASGPITPRQIDGETVADFIFFSSPFSYALLLVKDPFKPATVYCFMQHRAC